MRRTAILVTLAALCAAPPLARAQHQRGHNRGQAPAAQGNGGGTQEQLSLREAREALRSNDPARVRAGIQALTVIGTPEVIPPLVELLHSGPPDEITDYVTEQLGIIGLPQAIEELSNLLHHRRPAVRRGAVRALAQIRGDGRVRPLIESALHDSDAEVRAEAARGLGEIGARQSIPLLFHAFDRGVPDAAEAIGRLGGPEVAVSAEAAHDREDPRTTSHQRTLAMYLGRVPLGVLLRGFERFLNRRDIPVATKQQIIARLEDTASSQARDFLNTWVRNLPSNYRGPDRDRALQAIDRIRPQGSAPAGGSR